MGATLCCQTLSGCLTSLSCSAVALQSQEHCSLRPDWHSHRQERSAYRSTFDASKTVIRNGLRSLCLTTRRKRLRRAHRGMETLSPNPWTGACGAQHSRPRAPLLCSRVSPWLFAPLFSSRHPESPSHRVDARGLPRAGGQPTRDGDRRSGLPLPAFGGAAKVPEFFKTG